MDYFETFLMTVLLTLFQRGGGGTDYAHHILMFWKPQARLVPLTLLLAHPALGRFLLPWSSYRYIQTWHYQNPLPSFSTKLTSSLLFFTANNKTSSWNSACITTHRIHYPMLSSNQYFFYCLYNLRLFSGILTLERAHQWLKLEKTTLLRPKLEASRTGKQKQRVKRERGKVWLIDWCPMDYSQTKWSRISIVNLLKSEKNRGNRNWSMIANKTKLYFALNFFRFVCFMKGLCAGQSQLCS